ncbi:MAG: DUF72 domain-containing protein [Bacteroidota bacterium]|nr:DUF72 domain-containing protein [Bacteroidota bacterium]
MDFGKVENLDEVDFTLPDDHPDTEKLLKNLKKSKKQKQEVYVGCAKWGIKEWNGKLYPPKTKDKDFRVNYLKQFNCIELNPTHYRIQSAASIKEWKTGAEKDFKFCPKFYQGISHFGRLKNCERLTQEFYDSINNFENNLGTCFLQMPPNFPPKNFSDLENYLQSLPKKPEVCLELRHPLWFSDTKIADDTYQMLMKNKTGFAITDTAGRRDLIHMRLSTPTAFIRFVGNSLHPTDYTRIDDWVSRIRQWLKSGINTVYFLMHMHDERYSPELCVYTIKQINKHCGLNLKEPKLFNGEQENIL